jgi:hypothetical protein
MKQKIISATIAAFALLVFAQAHATDAQNTISKPALPQALSASDLADLSGGASPTGVAITKQTLTAVNSGNSLNAGSITTGDVSIGAGAFNGFNGVGNFVFNTGNNNNVQGSLSVTIVTPAN